MYTPNIHALSGIGTHDHGLLASEDSSCLRPLGYRDRQLCLLHVAKNIRIDNSCRLHILQRNNYTLP
jgi:hypothetical protein